MSPSRVLFFTMSCICVSAASKRNGIRDHSRKGPSRLSRHPQWLHLPNGRRQYRGALSLQVRGQTRRGRRWRGTCPLALEPWAGSLTCATSVQPCECARSRRGCEDGLGPRAACVLGHGLVLRICFSSSLTQVKTTVQAFLVIVLWSYQTWKPDLLMRWNGIKMGPLEWSFGTCYNMDGPCKHPY